METCFNDYAKEYHYEVTVESVNEQDSFWKMVNNFETIKMVNFKFNSPNFFDGLIDFNKITKLLKDKFNNTKTNLILKNDNDRLTLNRNQEEIIEMLDYIDQGGGSWTASVIEDDKKVTKQSNQYAKKVYLEGDLNNLFKNNDEMVSKKINDIDDVMDND